MDPHRKSHPGSLFRQGLAGFLVITGGAPGLAQQFPNQGMANYNWSIPHGSLNYNYSFMRYGQGGFEGSGTNPMMQSQAGPGMGTATYGVNGQVTTALNPGVNPYGQAAVAQDMQTQRQMQIIEPRYDVRKKTTRATASKSRQASKRLTLDQVLSPGGKVLWPGKVPSEGELGKSKAAAEAAIGAAFEEYKSDGKAAVQKVVEAKERLYAYGHPALDRASRQSRQSAQKLLHFLTGLEQAIDSLGGV